MKYLLLFLLPMLAGAASTSHVWPLDAVDQTVSIRGKATVAPGAESKSLVLDGQSLVELRDSSGLNSGSEGFTFSVWFNPYFPNQGQQVIAAKNRYVLGERQWSLTVEPDGALRAYLQQGGWKTILTEAELKAGHWHLATLSVSPAKAVLYLDGKSAGEVSLAKPLPSTMAPITLGGVNDDGQRRQLFHGAVDDARFDSRPLTSAEIVSRYHPVTATHDIPKPLANGLPLWDSRHAVLKTAELPVLADVRFSVIKPYEFDKDGYRFLHGLGLVFHQGKLYASFGHNKGSENTAGEQARYCTSDDLGKTWSLVSTIASAEPGTGVSHGVFLSHQGKLWAFQGSYKGTLQEVQTRAYQLDEQTQQWQAKGVIIQDGFWPMQEPLKMADGNWIMSGISAGEYNHTNKNPAAVAISRGDDFLHWDLVIIPAPVGINMWGESTVFIEGRRITSVSRYGGQAKALVATSEDYGRTWTTSLPTNLPMAGSKPYTGTLSNGQHYLIGTTTADSGHRRSPLTIAVTRPGETVFSKIFVIRHAVFPEGPGESHEKASLSYPYAIEHEGYLYVGYSNNGGGVGRVGKGRELANNNSAELAVIPIKSLQVK